MISRVADHCFWLGRYLERTESITRVLSVTRTLALDGELTSTQAWQPALIVSGEHPRFVAEHGEAAVGDGERVQRDLVWEHSNPVSLAHSLNAARENARAVREVVSLETWEVLNELYLWTATSNAQQEFAEQRDAFYRRVMQATQLALGLMRSTMLHDEPLDFIWLGVMLERSGQTARLLDVHHHAVSSRAGHGVVQTSLWLSLLRACSGFEPFMKRHQGRVSRASVAGFVLLEPDFPRSVRYTVKSALRILQDLNQSNGKASEGNAQRQLEALDTWLRALTPEQLGPDQVHPVLTRVVNDTAAVCEDICKEIINVGTATSGGVSQ